MAVMALDEGLERLNRRTTFVRSVIYVYIAVSLASLAAVVGEIYGLVDLDTGADAISQIAGLAHLVFFIVFVASVILVAMWIYRAHANLHAADYDGLEFTPGWAVGYYFIPILNLFKPFQAMRELWNVSNRQSDSYTAQHDSRLTLWWGCWIVSNIISNVSVRFQSSAGEGALTTGMVLDIVSTLISMGAAVFLLQIVTAINTAQHSIVGVETTFA